jgi:hypothetical protein
MVARKAQLHANQPNSQQVLAEKARLVQLRNVAVIRKDAEETEDLSRQLRELQDQHPDLLEERREAPVETKAFREEKARKHNLELIRKAEEAERERRRKLVQESPARGTPPIGPVAVDLSARVKIMPRLRHNANSRSVLPSVSFELGHRYSLFCPFCPSFSYLSGPPRLQQIRYTGCAKTPGTGREWFASISTINLRSVFV